MELDDLQVSSGNEFATEHSMRCKSEICEDEGIRT